jgi:hypothetical protein
MDDAPPEHADAVAAAREHLDAIGPKPLRPLPADFDSSRLSLHRVAEHLLMPKRVLETGNEIALRFTPRGFGTPPWERGQASGTDGQIRVEGTEVVLDEGGLQRRVEAGDPRAEADLIGLESAGIEAGEGLAVDPAAADALADWFAYGTVVLAALLDGHSDLDPEPIRLWPEHFDVATVLGDEAAGTRANYGASPGDDEHPEPYLYVGPWQQQPAGEIWNATAFEGAELGYAELLGHPDQLGAGLEFMRSRLRTLIA